MLVEGRLEPAVAQEAAFEPVRGEAVHLGDDGAGVDVRGAEEFERARGAAAFGKGRAFQHHGAGIGAGHPEVGGVGAGVHPDAICVGPAIAWAFVGLPTFHGDHAVVDVELEVLDEPVAQLAQCQSVAHGHGAGAYEAFPALAEGQALYRAAHGVWTVEHPDRLAVAGGLFQHVAQRRDEGVDAAAQVLQVDEDGVEGVHHLRGGPADLAVEAEDGNAEQGVGEVGRLYHVVLLVAAQAVLGAEGGGELQSCALAQGVEAVCQVARDRGRVGQQGDALAQGVEAVCQVARDRGRVGQQGDAAALKRGTQSVVFKQAVDAELHGDVPGQGAGSDRTKPSGW